jgi:hypothetical protein
MTLNRRPLRNAVVALTLGVALVASTAARPIHHTGGTVYVANYPSVQAAANATQSGGTLVFPAGVVYTESTAVQLPAGITVQGNASVLKTPDNTTTSTSDDSLLLAASGDTVSGLVFDGDVHNQNGVWNQHRHAIRVNGGSNVTITGDTFQNLIGDGVYIVGASSVTVASSHFNGDHSNRNGVSVISGSNIYVHDNVFNSMARPDMPGAVDLEPNTASENLTNVQVYNNTVNDPAKYGLLMWDPIGAPTSGIVFHDNTVVGGAAQVSGGAGILLGYGNATANHNAITSVPQFNGIEDDYATVTVTNNNINGAWDGINNWYGHLTQSGNTFANIGDKDVATT